MLLRRTVARLLVLLSAGATSVVLSAPALAAPTYTAEERALAVASPGLVYLETVYTGYVRDKQTNAAVLASPVTYNRRCSGFVVNSDGSVATTRTCVDPPDETVHQQMLYVAGFMLIGEKKLTTAQLDAWVAGKMTTTAITGLTDGSPLQKQLYGQLGIATGALTGAPAITGTLVRSADPADGDVAVVKLSQGNLPAVELADMPLASGTPLLAVGFNTDDPDPRIGTYAVQSTSVQLVGNGKRGTATYFRTDKTLGTYYHGGMALDDEGRVVGMVNEDPTLPNNTNKAVYPASNVKALLGQAGVANTLGSTDKLYRAGLNDYFSGHYSGAISRLDEVGTAVPSNKLAAVYRQRAVDRRATDGDATARPDWLIPAVAGVGGAILSVAIALVVITTRRRRRRRRRPAPPRFAGGPVSGGAPGYGWGAPPVSGPGIGAPVSGSGFGSPAFPSSGPPLDPYGPASGPPLSGPPVSPGPGLPGPFVPGTAGGFGRGPGPGAGPASGAGVGAVSGSGAGAASAAPYGPHPVPPFGPPGGAVPPSVPPGPPVLPGHPALPGHPVLPEPPVPPFGPPGGAVPLGRVSAHAEVPAPPLPRQHGPVPPPGPVEAPVWPPLPAPNDQARAAAPAEKPSGPAAEPPAAAAAPPPGPATAASAAPGAAGGPGVPGDEPPTEPVVARAEVFRPSAETWASPPDWRSEPSGEDGPDGPPGR